MRPTLRTVILFGAAVPLFLILVLVDERLWVLSVTYLGLAIVLTGLDGILAFPGRALEIEPSWPAILYIGETEELGVGVMVAQGRQRTTIEIACDVGPILVTPDVQRAPLVPGQRTWLAIPLAAKRRGTAEIHRIWLRWHGPLDLMRNQAIFPIAATIPVVPNVRAVHTVAIRFSSTDALFGIKAQSQQGDGSDFDSLREYTPGLDHRSIDWKHTARHRSLICKEFRAERNHQIILAFDTGHLMSEPLDGIPKLDRAVNAGLVLGYLSLRSGDRVGVFAFDSSVRLAMAPFSGVQNFSRLQRASSQLEYRNEETNFTLGLAELLGRLNRRSLVILQTEFVDTITAEMMLENVERLAARHLVIFVTLRDPGLLATVDAPPRSVGDVTRSVIADDFIRERLVVLERLRRLGVHCLDAPTESVDVDLLNRYIEIKRKELI